ncbi:hypothetical protein ACKWTF_015811 [Chironomus riparius]
MSNLISIFPQNFIFLFTILSLIDFNSFQFTNCKYLRCHFIQHDLISYKTSHDYEPEAPVLQVDPSIEIFRHYHQTKYCESYVSIVNLNNEDLQKVTDCTTIDFNRLNLEIIEFEFGNEFYHLQGLAFDNNKLKEFPNFFLTNLPNLRKFSAKNNFLEVLDENFFKYNKKLKIVNFSGNLLRSLSPNLFINLKKLIKLHFYENFCINSGYPETSIEDLARDVKHNCNEELNMIEFVKNLVLSSADLNETKTFIYLLHNSSASNNNLPNLTESFSNLIKSSTHVSNSSNLLSDHPVKLTEIFKNIIKSPKNQEHLSKILISDTKINQIFNTSITTIADHDNKTTTSSQNFNMEELIEVLFWMIIPITLLLFIILTLISYAIYKKYVTFSTSSRSRGEVHSLCLRGLDVY